MNNYEDIKNNETLMLSIKFFILTKKLFIKNELKDLINLRIIVNNKIG